MILLLFHDRCSGPSIAWIKEELEERYGPYGLRVRDAGYLHVPLRGPLADASLLLKHLLRMAGGERALWLVDCELVYPGVGPVMGCSSGRAALLYSGLDPEVLVSEGMHETGHLLGLPHCQGVCVMQLSSSTSEAREKPAFLCEECSGRLVAGLGHGHHIALG